MKLRWVEPVAAALLATAGCVSFDRTGPAAPDITGTYAATVTLTYFNEYETRTDAFLATLALRNTDAYGDFAGTYAIAPNDSGPVAGTLAFDGSLVIGTFGSPPKPIAGVQTIRDLYPWCDLTLMGMPALRGSLVGDTLHASVEASIPCVYTLSAGRMIKTELVFDLTAVR